MNKLKDNWHNSQADAIGLELIVTSPFCYNNGGNIYPVPWILYYWGYISSRWPMLAAPIPQSNMESVNLIFAIHGKHVGLIFFNYFDMIYISNRIYNRDNAQCEMLLFAVHN